MRERMPHRPDLDALVRRRDAEVRASTAAEVERILGIADRAERIRAYAELSHVMAEDGEALPAETVARIAAETREERRARNRAEEAARDRLELARLPAAALVPLLAAVPGIAAAALAGWGPLDVLAALLELPWLGWPLVALAALVAGVAVLTWWTAARASTTNHVLTALSGALVGGAALVVAVDALPIYRAGDGVRAADGTHLGGSIVRVEARWPHDPDLLHVLAGNGRVIRGDVLTLRGAAARQYLSGK